MAKFMNEIEYAVGNAGIVKEKPTSQKQNEEKKDDRVIV